VNIIILSTCVQSSSLLLQDEINLLSTTNCQLVEETDITMAVSNAAQFGLLLWKNWLLQKRRIVVTTFQILIPALIAFILLLLRMVVDSNPVDSPTIWNSFEASSTLPPNLTLPSLGKAESPKWMLAYSPSTSTAAKRMAQRMTQMLNITPFPIGMSLMFFFHYI